MPALPDPLLGGFLGLRDLGGLPVFALPSSDALLRLTALQTLSLVGPLDRPLGPPAGMRRFHTDNTDDVQARPLSGATAKATLCPIPYMLICSVISAPA